MRHISYSEKIHIARASGIEKNMSSLEVGHLIRELNEIPLRVRAIEDDPKGCVITQPSETTRPYQYRQGNGWTHYSFFPQEIRLALDVSDNKFAKIIRTNPIILDAEYFPQNMSQPTENGLIVALPSAVGKTFDKLLKKLKDQDEQSVLLFLMAWQAGGDEGMGVAIGHAIPDENLQKKKLESMVFSVTEGKTAYICPFMNTAKAFMESLYKAVNDMYLRSNNPAVSNPVYLRAQIYRKISDVVENYLAEYANRNTD